MGGGDAVVSLMGCGVEEVLDNRTNSISHQRSHSGWEGGLGKEGGRDLIAAAPDHQDQQDQYKKSTHQILNAGSGLSLASAIMAGVYQ